MTIPVPGKLKPSTSAKLADVADIEDAVATDDERLDTVKESSRLGVVSRVFSFLRNRTLTVDSIAQLREALAAGTVADVYRVRWHTTQGDKGGGKFLPIDSAGVIDNNGTLIVGGTLAARRDCTDINVRMFGAQGTYPATGNPDDSIAINAAIQSLPATGGTVYVPDGGYRCASSIAMRPGVTLKGTGCRIGGPCCLWLDGEGALVTIGELCNHARLHNLVLRGTIPFLSPTHTVGIQATGSYPNSSTQCGFERVGFYGFGTGIYVLSTGNEWQFDNVPVHNCQFANCNRGIWTTSQNTDYWSVRDCSIAVVNIPADEELEREEQPGIGIFLQKSGFFTIDTCAGGGANGTGSCFIRTTVAGPIFGHSLQAESIDYALILDSEGAGNTHVFAACIHDARISIRGNSKVIFIGGNAANFQPELLGGDSRVYNYGMNVPLGWDIRNNSLVVVDGSKTLRSSHSSDGFPARVNEAVIATADTFANVLTAQPSVTGNYLVAVQVRVANASTSVEVHIVHTCPGVGTSDQIVFTYAPLGVGVHSLGSWLVNSQYGLGDAGGIRVRAIAETANNVYVSASIVPMFPVD